MPTTKPITKTASASLLLASLLMACPSVKAVPRDTKEKAPAAEEPAATKVAHVDGAAAGKLWKEKKDDKQFAVLDVRRLEEYREGHIPKAILIDVLAEDFEEKAKKLDKKKTYLIHCRSGRRSQAALEKLESLGFAELVHLDGGIMAWEAAGNKVEPGEPAQEAPDQEAK